ncbi:S24 family peptidase [Candidatus Palauibacter sp.]|uniref:S24 family peptidase n=1 Tax=Candidatus Palauibacter sp. TaxID=3101350 RepID=UPI003CC653F6
MIKGHVPKLDRAAAIADALEFRFELGRESKQEQRDRTLRETLDTLYEEVASLRVEIDRSRVGPQHDVLPFPVPGEAYESLDVLEIAAAAGAGAMVYEEEPVGVLKFRTAWMRRRGLARDKCEVIGVKGDSMHPTLPDGCSILVNRSPRRRREGRIFVVLAQDGLIAKRAGKDEDGRWLMLSDNEDQENYPPVPWKRGDRLIGEVVWMGRTF